MPKINLKAYYPFYTSDCWIDVPQSVADELAASKRAEHAWHVKIQRHHAYYSLDVGDEIEGAALFTALRPEEIVERRIAAQQLYAALLTLPPKQARRIYAHFFLGMGPVEIARIEGKDESAIRQSIKWGLKSLSKKLKRME